MKAYIQRLGRALMLPVACLPAAALFLGIGYWIDPIQFFLSEYLFQIPQ